MNEELAWLEPLSPEQIMEEAIEKYKLEKVYVLYSGGKDSGCCLHYIAKNYPDLFGGAVFTNVGLGAQATRKFVIDYCHRMNWPLTMTWPREYENFYNTLMKFGWAKPPFHRVWMGRLKQHSWYAFMREIKRSGIKGAFISGVRKKESMIRDKRRLMTKTPTNFCSGQIYVKPFLYKNGVQLWDYYYEHKIEKSPVYEWLNRSGECYCGAFLADWELKMIQLYDPFAFETIKWYEKQLAKNGTSFAKKYSRYGGMQTTDEIEEQTTFEDFGQVGEVDEDLCGESCVV